MKKDKVLEKREMLRKISEVWDYVAIKCDEVSGVDVKAGGEDLDKTKKISGEGNIVLTIKVKNG